MKELKLFSLMLMLFAFCVTSTSCSSDDDEPGTGESNIVGTWVVEGSDDTNYTSYTFDSDGSGVCFEKYTSGSMTLTDSWGFVYAYDEESKSLQLYPEGDTTVYRYTVNLTGNTLMLTRNNQVLILIKQ
ncbi:MAG: hypothetical protein IJN66_07555 [Muribaculaceae bacterium]|nr:hypothetical protein [Muribaculaceae bacterium]